MRCKLDNVQLCKISVLAFLKVFEYKLLFTISGSLASHGTSPNVEEGLYERLRGTILGLIMIVAIFNAMMIAICYALMRAKM